MWISQTEYKHDTHTESTAHAALLSPMPKYSIPPSAILKAQEGCSTWIGGPAGDSGKNVMVQSIDTMCVGFALREYLK